MFVQFDEKYAISAQSSENKQNACMRFMWILMSEAAEGNFYAADGTTPFQFRKKHLKNFLSIMNPKLFSEACQPEKRLCAG